MRYVGHLTKARRLRNIQVKLDSAFDWELIIEGIYGSALHCIDCICEKKLDEHLDTHKGLPRFLDENGLSEVAELFRRLDFLRMSLYYGG